MSEYGLGCLPAQPHEKLAVASVATVCAPTGDTPIPPTLNAREWLTINNQGPFNSCCGNATDKALEWDAYVGSRQRVSLSARMSYLVAQEAGRCRDGRDLGVSIEAGAMGAREFGTCLESDFPYWRQGQRFDASLPDGVLRGSNPYKIGAVAECHNAREIIQRLGTGQGATILGIYWTTGLAGYDGRKPITIPLGGRNLGGHAICACDHEIQGGRQFVRIWNSHGSDWGQNGTMLVAADLVDNWLAAMPFGAYTVTGLQGFQKRPFQFEGVWG